jgi:hypothetical protein
MQEPEDTKTYANDSATSSSISTELAQRRSAPVLKAGKVYFIRCRHAIKIGFSLMPDLRIVELQTGSPHDLKLLGWVAGNTDTERSLHDQFEEHKIRGEWFRAHPDLLDFIKRSAVRYNPTSETKPISVSGSAFDFENTRRDLIARRAAIGSKTRRGHAASNLVELLKNLQTAEGFQRQNIIKAIPYQMTRLAGV